MYTEYQMKSMSHTEYQMKSTTQLSLVAAVELIIRVVLDFLFVCLLFSFLAFWLFFFASDGGASELVKKEGNKESSGNVS